MHMVLGYNQIKEQVNWELHIKLDMELMHAQQIEEHVHTCKDEGQQTSLYCGWKKYW